MKQVFQTEMTLFPREDKNFYAVSFDTIAEIRKEHPEFDGFLWGVTLTEFTVGTAHLKITVTDHNAPDHRETVKVFLWIVVVFIILVGLTYL